MQRLCAYIYMHNVKYFYTSFKCRQRSESARMPYYLIRCKDIWVTLCEASGGLFSNRILWHSSIYFNFLPLFIRFIAFCVQLNLRLTIKAIERVIKTDLTIWLKRDPRRASMICLWKINAYGSFTNHVGQLLSRVKSSPISMANGARRTCVIEVSDHPIAEKSIMSHPYLRVLSVSY